MTTGVLRVGSSTVRIRPARAADVDAIAAIGREVLPATYVDSGLLPGDEVQTLLETFWSAEYFASVLAGDGSLFVADTAGWVVGMAETGRLSDADAVLWKLYVIERFRGTGVGSALLAEAEASLGADVERLVVEFVTGNDAAAGFYAAQGFAADRIEVDRRPGVDASYTWLARPVPIQSQRWTG